MSVQNWKGSCHCGNVRYDVAIDASSGITCNCSMCQRKGSVLQFVAPDAFKLESGEGEQTVYNFNKNVIDHLFCRTCGVTSFARGRTPDGRAMIAINLRCLEGIDLDAVDKKFVDGRAR